MGEPKMPVVVAFVTAALIGAVAVYESGPWISPTVIVAWVPAFLVFVLLLVRATRIHERRARRTAIYAVLVAVGLALMATLTLGSKSVFLWRLNVSRGALIAEAEQRSRFGVDRSSRLVGLIMTHGSYFEDGYVIFNTHDGIFVPYGVAVAVERDGGKLPLSEPRGLVGVQTLEPPFYFVGYKPPKAPARQP